MKQVYVTGRKKKKKKKTYSSRYSLVVTHLTTNRPIAGLCIIERTGYAVLLRLWTYVTVSIDI